MLHEPLPIFDCMYCVKDSMHVLNKFCEKIILDKYRKGFRFTEQFVQINTVHKEESYRPEVDEVIEENEEELRNVKISYLATTSSFKHELYKPQLKY